VEISSIDFWHRFNKKFDFGAMALDTLLVEILEKG
jgi:hypothetical protein